VRSLVRGGTEECGIGRVETLKRKCSRSSLFLGIIWNLSPVIFCVCDVCVMRQCATSRKVVGSIPDRVIGIYFIDFILLAAL
jgi:hypothetical protein